MADDEPTIYDETNIAPPPEITETDRGLGGADPGSYKGQLNPNDEDFIGNKP